MGKLSDGTNGDLVSRRFYVYEHWRPDQNVCFYVGKGSKQRAYNFHRRREGSINHLRIVSELKILGFSPEVRFVQLGLSEVEAFDLEIERIRFWKAQGVVLANMTDGGDGVAGRKLSAEAVQKLKNRIFTEEHRRKISEAKKDVAQSPDHIAKASAARRGKKHPRASVEARSALMRGRKRPPEVGAKISAALKGKPNFKNRGLIPWCKGKHLSQETKDKMSAARRGRKRGPMSLVQKEKIRHSLLGRSNLALKGKHLSEEHRQKLVDAWVIRRARVHDDQVGERSPQKVQQSQRRHSSSRT